MLDNQDTCKVFKFLKPTKGIQIRSSRISLLQGAFKEQNWNSMYSVINIPTG